MTIFTLMLAATMTVGLQKAATLMTGQQGMASFVRGESAYAGLAPEEADRRRAEHERLGKSLAETLGFAIGETFDSYEFKSATTNANYVLPRPALGFAEFQPFVTDGKLCGLYLKRDAGKDEDGEYSDELFDAELMTSRTNLAAVLSLQTNNLSVAANGVPHVWRISYEKWRTFLVLRICDEELSWNIALAAEQRRVSEEAARQAELMKQLERD